MAHQPAYLPWQGYFARLLDVDRFVVLDHVAFAERGWQHRSFIRGPAGLGHRLSVPVRRAGRFGQRIDDVELADPRWALRHWRTIEQVYRRAPHFEPIAPELHDAYQRRWTHLADVNLELIRLTLRCLGLDVEIIRSSLLPLAGAKTAMLVELCGRLGASVLRVGTGAPRYLDRGLLRSAGIAVEVVEYTHHPHRQGGHPFLPGLATVDLVLHAGPGARGIMAAGTAIRPWAPA